MKRKWILGILAIAVSAFLVIGSILVVEYRSDGIHFLGRNVHIRLVQECYLIHNGQIIGTTSVAMDGYSRRGTFDGYLYVDDYPIPLHEAIARNSGGNKGGFPYHTEGDYVDIFYEGVQTVNSKVQSSQYQYLLMLDKNKPEQFVLFIYTEDYGQCVAVAVPAPTPEDALALGTVLCVI